VQDHTVRGFGLAIGLLLLTALSAAANAGTVTSSTGATVTGVLPGQVLWTDYAAFGCADGLCVGDSIIRVINPNGQANVGITAESQQPVCAMVYVFDDAEEMEECCGCPISSAGMLSFSVDFNLQDNGVFGDDDGLEQGVVAIVAATPDLAITTFSSPSNGHDCTLGQSGACNVGCDPTQNPGYTVTTTNNLLGSRIYTIGPGSDYPQGLTETALHDDGTGDPNNLTHLRMECGQLVGNGSGAGICSCPAPGDSEVAR
jgi:hypothetical protein